jgi:hypothetical protein
VFNYNMLSLAQYRWEGQDALTPGKHTIVFDYTYDGPGIAKGGSGVLNVDGKVVATEKQPNSIAFLQVADETFDVGIDTRTGVNDKDYQVPFAFNGKIDQATVRLGPMQLTSADPKADPTCSRQSQRLGGNRQSAGIPSIAGCPRRGCTSRHANSADAVLLTTDLAQGGRSSVPFIFHEQKIC